MSDADGTWVEVMRTDPAAEKAVLRALEREEIRARAHRPGVIQRMMPGRRSLTVYVQKHDETRARAVLDEHLAEGEANIEQHLKRLPAELSVGGGGVLAVVGIWLTLDGGGNVAKALAVVGVVVFLWGWRWLKAHPRTPS